MYHFFVSRDQIGADTAAIRGGDVNHIRNVLRMKPGERIFLSDEDQRGCICEIGEIKADLVTARILWWEEETRELPARLCLFQGLPKKDKMELVIQKAVELGVYEVIPVITRRTIVKLDEKKAAAKVTRWNMIAESSAKQSGRNLIPNVREVMTFAEALTYAKDFEVKVIPYEHAEGMEETRRELERIRPGTDMGIFIGPEGGFEEEEIRLAESMGVRPISLGRRILRTETAGLAVLSVAGYLLETAGYRQCP